MSDKDSVDILYSPQWDDAAAKRVSDGFDALREKAKQASDLEFDVDRLSKPTFGENLVAGVEDATTRFEDFKSEVKQTAQELEHAADRALKFGSRVTAAFIGIGAASATAFERRFGATDPQAVEQRRATKQFEAAFEDLGRVASRFLVPAFENLAGVVEIVAKGLDTLFPENQTNPIQDFFDNKIPAAAEAFNDLVSSVRAFGALVERDLGNQLDTFATNVRMIGSQIQEGFAKVINALLEGAARYAESLHLDDLAKGVRGGKDTRTQVGPRPGGIINQFEQDRLNEQTALEERIRDRNKKAAATAKEIVETNEKISEGLKATGALFQAAKDDLKEGRIGLDEVNAWRDRKQALQDEQKAYDASVVDAQKKSNQALVKLHADRDKALDNLASEQRKSEAELTERYNQDKQESLEKFQQREEEIEAEGQLRRELNARKHELTLEELAARGDVAGFIEEQKRYRLSLDEQAKTDQREKEQRQKAYDDQSAEQDEQYALDLDKLHQSGVDKENELRSQYQDQENELTAALTEQLNILYDKHVAEQQAIEQDFLRTLAELDSNLAGLNDLRNTYYQRDLMDLESYLEAHNAGMRQLYSDAYGTGVGGSSGENARLASGSIGSFESAYTPSDNMMSVVFENGAIQNTVGDIATQSMMEAAEQRIVTSIASGLQRGPIATEY